MWINFIVFAFFGAIVFSDVYKHRKDRPKFKNALLAALAVLSVAVAFYNIVPRQ